MCRSMVDIQSATTEIRQGKERRRRKKKKKPDDENIMACPIPQGGHNKASFNASALSAAEWWLTLIHVHKSGWGWWVIFYSWHLITNTSFTRSEIQPLKTLVQVLCKLDTLSVPNHLICVILYWATKWLLGKVTTRTLHARSPTPIDAHTSWTANGQTDKNG